MPRISLGRFSNAGIATDFRVIRMSGPPGCRLSLVEGLSNPPKPQISCFKRVDIAPDSAGAIQHPGTVMPTGLPITFHDVLTRRDSEADLFDGTLDCDSVHSRLCCRYPQDRSGLVLFNGKGDGKSALISLACFQTRSVSFPIRRNSEASTGANRIGVQRTTSGPRARSPILLECFARRRR